MRYEAFTAQFPEKDSEGNDLPFRGVVLTNTGRITVVVRKPIALDHMSLTDGPLAGANMFACPVLVREGLNMGFEKPVIGTCTDGSCALCRAGIPCQ